MKKESREALTWLAIIIIFATFIYIYSGKNVIEINIPNEYPLHVEYEDGSSADLRVEVPISRKWQCKQVVTCEPADWIGIDGYGKAKPEDHCQYEYKTITATKNPANYPEYGASCEEIK